MNEHFETPDALRHDARTLADDVRALVNATSQMADAQIVKSRERLTAMLASGRDLVTKVERRAEEGARAADECVRQHPYQSMFAMFALGAIAGCWFARRS